MTRLRMKGYCARRGRSLVYRDVVCERGHKWELEQRKFNEHKPEPTLVWISKDVVGEND
jgi:hypothetical protein